MEGNTLWEQYHRHQRLRGCIAVIIETMELDDCGWGLAALEKDKERLRGRLITHLRSSVKVRGPPCHQIKRVSSAARGQKKLKFGPGINYKSSRFPEKIEFTTEKVGCA